MVTVDALFDPATYTLTYVAYDPATRDAVIVDPVLDFDPETGATATASLEKLVAHLAAHRLTPRLLLETHAHADHLTAARVLKERFPGLAVACGERIKEVQATFAKVYPPQPGFQPDGRPFDRLLKDGETVRAGSLAVEVIATPGHTPACCSYKIGDAVFTGDALFMPDYGTGRCDFPGGDARQLYRSIVGRLYALPEATRAFTGHDYQPGGRPLRYEASIGEQRRANVHLTAATKEDAYVRFREERDRTLTPPKLLAPSIRYNVLLLPPI